MSSPPSSPSLSTSSTRPVSELTAEQLSRIERNRQKALLLRQQKQQKLTSHELYSLEANNSGHSGGHSAPVGTLDSGGGFLIDSDDDNDRKPAGQQPPTTTIGGNSDDIDGADQVITCEECGHEFNKSFLWTNYSHKTCDSCRDLKGRHSMITRTEAKAEYLLKDVDLDRREPALRYIVKRNPREFARHDMRLYLREQVEDRALQVWGSEEAIERERERRTDDGKRRKQKQYDKRLKSLRMTVRSSLYTRETASGHRHEFGDEIYNESDDKYEKTCKTCGHTDSYEKM